MRTILIAIFTLFLFSTFATAQIVITAEELLDVGDDVVQAFDDSPEPTILPGDPGANKVWDFRDLFADEVDTFSFVSPVTTPYWPYFPASNLAFITGSDSSYVYFDKNSDALLMVGIATEMDDLGEVFSPVVPNEEFLVFPYEYGYQGNETFHYDFAADVSLPGIDSMKMRRTIEKFSLVDAWGTMTVPMGTYDVLRVHETRDYTDTIWAKLAIFGWQVFSVEEGEEERYLWWSDDPEVGYVLVNLNIAPGTGEVTDSEFMAAPQAVGLGELQVYAGLTVFPNPAEDRLYVKNNIGSDIDYILTDVTGKILFSGVVDPSTREFHSVDDLAPGLYFIRYTTGMDSGVLKVLKQ